MAAIDEITINYEDNGILTVKQLDKVILSSGAWATILFMYQTWDKKKEAYGEPVFTIRRYQKVKDAYIPKSKFNISSKKQAHKLIEALQNWL